MRITLISLIVERFFLRSFRFRLVVVVVFFQSSLICFFREKGGKLVIVVEGRLVLDLVSVLLDLLGDGLDDGWLLDDPWWGNGVGPGGSWHGDRGVGQWGWGSTGGQWQTGVGVLQGQGSAEVVGGVSSGESGVVGEGSQWETGSWESLHASWQSDLALSGGDDGSENNSEGLHGYGFGVDFAMRSTIKR